MSIQGRVQEKKACLGCGADVSAQRRYKTAQGQYYCERCYAQAQGKHSQQPSPKPQNKSAERSEPPDRAFSRALGLVSLITCPHCWHAFPPAQILWVSQHHDLLGDPVLGPEKARRFLPSRFNPDGNAIDAHGLACQVLGCPRCHLPIPRSLVETEPLFISIIGGPKTGKSYFLASMMWELRQKMPSEFALAFNDADTVSNQVLNEYEATLFLPEDPDRLAAIRKTELEGDLYDQVNIGGQIVSLPRPFLFNIRPTDRHPQAGKRNNFSRVICLYDNAGEHFQPGMDRAGSPVTQHLAKSRALMFLFDPTQDPRFRELCRGLSHDPQLMGVRNTQRQETLLIEASLRVRRYANLPSNAKHPRPLVVIVPKSDVWAGLLNGEDLTSSPILPDVVSSGIAGLDCGRIERVSGKLRQLLLRWTPELVAAAEDFCEHVIYIPVSALGVSPEEAPIGDDKSGLFVRPKSIAPRWVTVPILYMFAKWASGLIAGNTAPAHAVARPAAET